MQPSAASLGYLLRVALACVLTLCGGCSWLFVSEAPAQPKQFRYFDCTSSRVAPVLDSAGAVVYGLAAVAAASTDAFARSDRAAYTAVYAVTGALAIASAVYGFRQTDRCQTAKEEMGMRLDREHEQPLPQSSAGCTFDAQCKGDRICVDGLCVFPASVLTPLPPSAALPSAQPPAAAKPGEPQRAPAPAASAAPAP